jgi:hypothetical protein
MRGYVNAIVYHEVGLFDFTASLEVPSLLSAMVPAVWYLAVAYLFHL